MWGVDGISERPATSSGAVVAADKAEPHKDERTHMGGGPSPSPSYRKQHHTIEIAPGPHAQKHVIEPCEPPPELFHKRDEDE